MDKQHSRMLANMTLRRMDNVGIVVDDLAAAIAFFRELGLELEVEMPVEGRWVDRVIGLDGAQVDLDQAERDRSTLEDVTRP